MDHGGPEMKCTYLMEFILKNFIFLWYQVLSTQTGLVLSTGKRTNAGGFLKELPTLDHGGPEMKCTHFHRNCWKKIA